MKFEDVILTEEKITADTSENHFKKVVKDREQQGKYDNLNNDVLSFDKDKSGRDIPGRIKGVDNEALLKRVKEFNNNFASGKEPTKLDLFDIKSTMINKHPPKQINNDLAQAVSKKVIQAQINKISKPEQSNYQERFLYGRAKSKLGVTLTHGEIPDRKFTNFYVTFNNGVVQPNDSRGFGLDGLVKIGKKYYFVENKIASFSRQQDGSITKFTEAANKVGITPIFVCGKDYEKFTANLEKFINDGKLIIMKPEGFNNWLKSNGVKFVKKRIDKEEANKWLETFYTSRARKGAGGLGGKIKINEKSTIGISRTLSKEKRNAEKTQSTETQPVKQPVKVSVITEGLKHFKYSDALLKLAKKIKGKNNPEKLELKKLAIKAAQEFKSLEDKYKSASKTEKKELKQKYKDLKKKYSTLVKKINLKRLLTGAGASVLTLAGIMIGSRVQFELALKEFNISLDAIDMKDELVDIDANINRYGHEDGIWDEIKKDVRPELTNDYRKIFARDDNDTTGMKVNKIRSVIFNHRNPNDEYGMDNTWLDFNKLAPEVDELKKASEDDLEKLNKAWDKLQKTGIMKHYGITSEFRQDFEKTAESIKLSDNIEDYEKNIKHYRELLKKLKNVGSKGAVGEKIEKAFDDTAKQRMFESNLKFIDDITHMDLDEYLGD